MRNSQGFNARSTNFATGAPVVRETREREQYMNTTNNSQAILRDRSPGGSQWMSSYAQHKEREMGIADN